MGKKKEDAVLIIKDGLTRLDALDKLLAAPTVDQMAAQAAAKEFGGNTCAPMPQAVSRGRCPIGLPIRARGAVEGVPQRGTNSRPDSCRPTRR